MSYYMYRQDNEFRIRKDNIPIALKSISEWAAEVQRDTLCEVETIDEAFADFGFDVLYDADGNITDCLFEYGKLIDQDEFLFELAPFVESGSYLQMIGEDNTMWRWTFRDGKFEEVLPKIVWE